MQCPRKLERDRSGGGILVRLQGPNCLASYAGHIRQLFLRETERLSPFPQPILDFRPMRVFAYFLECHNT
jgi:hypothetical protein